MADDRAAKQTKPKPEDGIDATRPHSARMYDYVLGGDTHYAADRELIAQLGEALPTGVDFIRGLARHNRAFMGRAVRHMTGELGVRQFLDIGAGIPAYDNTHEIAQAIAPESRVVYVDFDPIVLAHAHRRLAEEERDDGDGDTDDAPLDPLELLGDGSGSENVIRRGKRAYVHADFRDPEEILETAGETIDFDQPVGLMLVALLHLVAEDRDPYGVVSRLVDVLAPGSFLLLSQFTADHRTEEMSTLANLYSQAGEPLCPRPYAEIEPFFAGLELLDPGLVLVDDWRPEGEVLEHMPLYGGLARKS